MMMSMDIAKSNVEMEKLRTINRSLGFIQFRIEFLRIRGLLWNPTGLEKTMKEISRVVDEEQAAIQLLCNGIETVQNKYKTNEVSITDYLRSHGKGENITYDDTGRYGGDQGSPKNIQKSDDKYEEIVAIIRKYYPDYSEKDIENFLKKMNSEGCGYVALINTVFNQYVGRTDEFEETFGFPMYDENGDLNFDLMLVDFYSAMDNHNLRWGKDVYNNKEDPSATKGYGTTAESREYRWETYLEDRGVSVDVHDVNVTVDNYDRISKDGEVIVSVHPVILYDSDGNCVVDVDGGHAMTITGVTEDGMYKVTSWGKEYYIKPDGQYDEIGFQQVSYEK